MDGKKQVLALGIILIDETIQPRVELNVEHVEDLETAYQTGKEVGCPTVWKIGDTYKLAKGFHRIAAMKRANLSKAEFLVREGTEEECAVDALCSNQTHGLKRTNPDKQRCVEGLLKLKPDWSNGKIAEESGVSVSTISKVRTQLEDKRDIPKVERRKGRDGKSRASERAVVKPKQATPAHAFAPDIFEYIQPESLEADEPASGDSTLQKSSSTDSAGADPCEPTIHPEFMPNAIEAANAVEVLSTWISRLASLRSDMSNCYPKRHVLARRIDLPELLGEIDDMIARLDGQRPEFPCPSCCGTTHLESGRACLICDTWGMIGREHYNNTKASWKKTMPRYLALKNGVEG